MRIEYIIGAAALIYILMNKNKKKPEIIEIVKADKKQKSVTYKINYNGETLTDTFFIGDKINATKLKGGLTAAAYDSGLNTVSVAIGVQNPDCGFKETKAEKIISF